MRLTRFFAAATLALTMLPLAATAGAAQRRTPAQEPVRDTAADRPDAGTPAAAMTAEETRRDLVELLRQYPPALPHVLRLDPSLLENSGYLAPYPALSAFLAKHPDIGHNPQYFFQQYGDNQFNGRLTPQDRAVDMWRETIEGFTIGTVVLLITSGLIWLIKTLIDQRRWSRLSKVQTEVHSKILDRFSSNEDLLAYIQTPAGRKFLESTPISVDAPRALAAPISRILWSAQAGAVLTVLGLGISIVSRTAVEEVASPLAAIGAVIVALGIGFLASAFLAYTLTRRFRLMPEQDASPESRG